ncbi:MAG: STAS/SEC14 domain-containing protein [Victivallales bacterium]|nr:STAS/SEC14 domain-containing protein [Victivallales bacterium]
MLHLKIDEKAKIAYVEPESELSGNDFANAARVIDPFIEKNGNLRGIIIQVKSFPGWDSFGSMIKHFKFIKEHHRKVAKVAMVTDSPIGGFAEHLAGHFVSAEIKHFPFTELENARKWISGN